MFFIYIYEYSLYCTGKISIIFYFFVVFFFWFFWVFYFSQKVLQRVCWRSSSLKIFRAGCLHNDCVCLRRSLSIFGVGAKKKKDTTKRISKTSLKEAEKCQRELNANAQNERKNKQTNCRQHNKLAQCL